MEMTFVLAALLTLFLFKERKKEKEEQKAEKKKKRTRERKDVWICIYKQRKKSTTRISFVHIDVRSNHCIQMKSNVFYFALVSFLFD